MQRLVSTSTRSKSTLAEKLRAAVSSAEVGRTKNAAVGTIAVKDDKGEDFRELFVMPKRKLRGQLLLEQQTGRAEVKQRSRMDLNDRLSLRRPRSEEMDPEQEWSDVWPAAKTFNASVVPLPVRMGSRRNVEKRAPFQKEGNLELIKIPNFLHLTPAAIEKHCNALKKFCTPFPEELLKEPSMMDEELPISVAYNNYIHQGTNIRDVRARVVTLKINLDALNLDAKAKEKMIRLAGSRFDEPTNTITIIADRCHTRQQNLDYAYYLLTVTYHEANKVEAWEELKQRQDSLKVEFEGSTTKSKLVDLLGKVSKSSLITPELKEASAEAIATHPKVNEFGEMWNRYRNSEETVEATREYGRQIRELLGLPAAISQRRA